MSAWLPDVRYDALLGVTDLFGLQARTTASDFARASNRAHCSQRIELLGPKPLSVWDQSVYLAVIAAVSRSEEVVCFAPGGLKGTLWDRLQVCGVGSASVAGTATVRWRTLARLAGVTRPGGKSIVLLKESLERLAAVECWFVQCPLRWAAQLIAWDSTEDGVQLALHPHATRVARGMLHPKGNPWRYALVSLRERYALASLLRTSNKGSKNRCAPATALVMHAWLSAWSRREGERTIKLETLWRHAFRDAVSQRSTKVRFEAFTLALRAIGRLPGWQVDIGSESCHIRRKAETVTADDSVDLTADPCGPDDRTKTGNPSVYSPLTATRFPTIPYKGRGEPRSRRGRPNRRRRRGAAQDSIDSAERRVIDSSRVIDSGNRPLLKSASLASEVS